MKYLKINVIVKYPSGKETEQVEDINKSLTNKEINEYLKQKYQGFESFGWYKLDLQ